MKKLVSFFLTGFCAFLCATVLNAKDSITLVNPAATGDDLRANASEIIKAQDGSYIEFDGNDPSHPWPGPIWSGQWNLEGCSRIVIDLENLEEDRVDFGIRIDDPSAIQNNANWFQSNIRAAGKKRAEYAVTIPTSFPPQLMGKVEGMRGLPGGASKQGAALEWKNVRRFFLIAPKREKPVKYRVYSIKASFSQDHVMTADWMKMTPEEFFPFIDCYGQFKYEDWPGKIHSDADFARKIADEKADLAANPRPKNWDAFGGWLDGPELKATGRFYPTKIDGKWWLVTPEGHLFWSHGTDCVGMSNGSGPIQFREHYFEGLPEGESPFYGWASTHIGFYGDKGTVRAFNWTQSNLKRKYGDDFARIHNELAHVRLASWAMNTIGNWSDGKIYMQQKTSYTVTLSARGRNIEGSEGYWGKFPDPFTDEFRKSMRESATHQKDALMSSYCVGAFTNNELAWGDETSLAKAALASPSDQSAKLELVKFLQKKYGTVEKLNAAWKTEYASWDAMIQGTDVPKTANDQKSAAYADLADFYTVLAEQYFRVIHEEIQAIAPGVLDLGCRFAWGNERATRAMAKYVDVMSFNRYQTTLKDFKLPEGIDRPVIIGEFHFGALDRGMFHTGLVATENQNDRAQKYYDYVLSALNHPNFVGTHWFQFGSQATTGRFDGENYQIGLLDLTDTPYPETIAKVREIGRAMYEIRYKKKD